MQFGNTIDNAVREELKSLLGILTIGGMSSYLGISESLGGAKTKVFSFVRKKLRERINGWTSKFLSKGRGQESSSQRT